MKIYTKDFENYSLFEEAVKKAIRENKVNGKVKAVFCFKDGYMGTLENENHRLAIATDGSIITMYKNSHRHGRYVGFQGNFDGLDYIEFKIPTKINPVVKWEKSWKRVSNKLEKSGLWSDYKKDVDTALSIGYEKINQAYKIYWRRGTGLSYKEQDTKNAEDIQKIDGRLVGENENGNLHVKTSILWHMSFPAKVKKMYFGKWNNESKLEQIQKAFDENKEARVFAQAGYDVSFSYNPESKKAWYSEEYHNCGNGHYYLALDATYAVFYEDD